MDHKAPDRVKLSNMRRDWWITYKWERIQTVGEAEPEYIKSGLRPIENSVEAAAQFDTSWRSNTERILT